MAGEPTAAQLLADGTRHSYGLAANHGAETIDQIDRQRANSGVGDFCNFDGRGWQGRPNGGGHGLDWVASHTYKIGDLVEPTTANGRYYKCTTAGTTAATEGTWPAAGVGNTKTSGTAVFTDLGATSNSQPTALNIGTFGGSTNPLKPAVIGSLPDTPFDQVMRVDGLPFNNTYNRFPLDAYLWSWQNRKGLGGWTGPNLDEHAFRIAAADPGDGTWRAIIDGVWFKDVNDAAGVAAGGGPVLFRNCLFESVGDDCCEADFANTPVWFEDCLFRNVYMGYSATGSVDRSAGVHTIFRNCVIVHNRFPWKTASTDSNCPNRALSNLTATTGNYWATGNVYKQPGAVQPRLELIGCQIFVPGLPQSCDAGFSGAGFLVNATTTTLRYGRGGSFHAGDGTIYPAVPNFPDDWVDYSGAVTIINDSVTWETQKDAAVNAWLADPAHPQFVEPAPAAALTRRTLTGATATANASQTITATPVGMQTGDWLYAVFSSVGGTVTHAAPTGWTQVANVFQSGLGISVWRINVQPGVAGPFTFDNGSGVNRRLDLAFEGWSGGHPTSPIVGTPQTVGATTATSLTHPSQDSGGSGRVWMLVTGKTTGVGLTSTMNTPAGFTEDFDLCTTHASQFNNNTALHRKTVGAGATGTQAVTSIGSGNPDATNQTYAGVSFLMAPAGSAQVIPATAAGTQTWGGTAVGQVITSAPAATGTVPSKMMGGGYENCGTWAPPGVGHNWLALIGADVAGFHVTTDGMTWKPANTSLVFGQHRVCGIAGSDTTANRAYAFCSADPQGTGPSDGRILRGTYDPTSGLFSWAQRATTVGATGGANDHPRQTGRQIVLDEANDALYVGTRDGVYKMVISTNTMTQRALAGREVTGMVLDPSDPQIMWVTCGARGTNPGFYRLGNIRSGTVTSSYDATFTDPQDLVLANRGATRHVYVAAMGSGVRRWTVSADATAGWSVQNGSGTDTYATGGNGCAGIDVFPQGTTATSDWLIASNAGNNNALNAGGWSHDGGATWTNEQPNWNINLVPWGETAPWWLGVGVPGMMLDGDRYDCTTPRFNPNNPQHIMLVGRSGVWLSRNGGLDFRPSVQGQCASVGWVVAADPNNPTRAVMGDGDWTLLRATNPTTTMVTQVRPQTGTGMGAMFHRSNGRLAVACGDTQSSSQGEVWTTDNYWATGVTWQDEGFGGATGAAPCYGVAIGTNASGSEVLLTVQGGAIKRKVGSGAVTSVQAGIGTTNIHPHFCWPNQTAGWVYLTASDGLWRSSDYGANWTLSLAYGNANGSDSTSAIHPDPDDFDILYLTADDGTTAGTGLFKINNARGSITRTKIGPTLNEPGPCAVDPVSGVVYVCSRAEDAAGVGLWASPSNNPGAATTFTRIDDAQWRAGPFEPVDMCVLGNQSILAATGQGGYYVASRAGAAAVVTATATIATTSNLDATGTVITATAGIVTATATITTTSGLAGSPDILVAGVPTVRGFNGTWWPRLVIRALLGGVWTTISSGPDLRSFTRNLGRDSPIDPANPGEATIVLGNRSGLYDPANTAAFGGHPLTIGTPIQVLAERPLGTTWPKFTGTIRKFSLDAGIDPIVTLACADGLERLGRTPTANQLRTFTSTTAGPRIGHLADLAAWDPAARSLDTGVSRLPVAMLLGDSVLELMRQVEQTEMGLLWVNESGTLVFYDRHRVSLATRSTTVQVALADTSSPGQLRMVELVMDRSTDRVYNDIHITRDADPAQDTDLTGVEPGDEPGEQITQDLTSIGVGGSNYGYLNLPADVGKLHASDAAALEQAQGLLRWFSTTQDRIEQVEINALHPRVKNEGLWDRLLSLTLLDRISVLRDYGPRTISGQLLVQAISEEVAVSPPTWRLTLTTSNPPPTPDRFILGTSRIGIDRIGW